MTTVFVILGCIVLFIVIKFFQSASPKGFAKQLAKVQLHALIRQKQIHPEYPKEEQYVMAIMTRPGYSEQLARDMVAHANEYLAKDFNRPLDFQIVVIALALFEFQARMKRQPGDEEMKKIYKRVLAGIPYEKLIYHGDVVIPGLKYLDDYNFGMGKKGS